MIILRVGMCSSAKRELSVSLYSSDYIESEYVFEREARVECFVTFE